MFFNLSAVASPLSPLGTYMNMCLPKLVKSSTLFSRHIFLYKTLSPKMLIYVLQIYQATNSSPTFSPCKGTRENNFTGGCKQSCVPSLKSYLEMYISAYFHKDASALIKENSWRVVTLGAPSQSQRLPKIEVLFPSSLKRGVDSSLFPWTLVTSPMAVNAFRIRQFNSVVLPFGLLSKVPLEPFYHRHL